MAKELLILLTELVVDDSRRGTATDLVRLLGAMRAIEAVPLLVDNVELEFFYKSTKRPQIFGDRFPCAAALAQIGVPSLEPLVLRVKSSDDVAVWRSAGFVFNAVLGPRLTKAYLDDRVNEESDIVKRQRLSKLRIEALSFGNGGHF